MTKTILVEAVTRRSAVQKMTVALDAWQGLWGALGWGSELLKEVEVRAALENCRALLITAGQSIRQH